MAVKLGNIRSGFETLLLTLFITNRPSHQCLFLLHFLALHKKLGTVGNGDYLIENETKVSGNNFLFPFLRLLSFSRAKKVFVSEEGLTGSMSHAVKPTKNAFSCCRKKTNLTVVCNLCRAKSKKKTT